MQRLNHISPASRSHGVENATHKTVHETGVRPSELQAAVEDALRAGVPHTNTVRAALERRRNARGTPPPVAMNLPEHVRRKDTPVQPHRLATYDQLSAEDDDTEPEQH